MVDLFAVTTRGLEAVSAEELAALPGVVGVTTEYRRVTARAEAPLTQLLTLRTVDDLFLSLARWSDLGPERAALARLRAYSARLDLRPAVTLCASVRPVSNPPTFSVTANFVGRRNYTANEIKLACATSIESRHRGWVYRTDDRDADLNVRVFVEHATAHVGIRLAHEPLQNRHYKQEHVPGSLRPPVAAAMAWLAAICVGDRVLDPCCGAGTLLIEAAAIGAVALGGDSDAHSLTAARANAAGACAAIDLQRWDAQALPVADSTMRRVCTNPPWGRKVAIEVDAAAFYHDIGREIGRVLTPDGKAVILTWIPEWVRAWDMHVVREIEISLYGRTPTIMVLERHSLPTL
ncbi:MAG: methyltransferase domain-containing protein [Anaerolineae bacterium]|jgi:23S rRNA G2445 N2-methylase RlmL|nr:methyltransferase domain-containing protein [Anaerolineae bacterium]